MGSRDTRVAERSMSNAPLPADAIGVMAASNAGAGKGGGEGGGEGGAMRAICDSVGNEDHAAMMRVEKRDDDAARVFVGFDGGSVRGGELPQVKQEADDAHDIRPHAAAASKDAGMDAGMEDAAAHVAKMWRQREEDEERMLRAAAAVLERRRRDPRHAAMAFDTVNTSVRTVARGAAKASGSGRGRGGGRRGGGAGARSVARGGDKKGTVVRLLPKFTEPTRNMCHWDHVIEEVTWVSKEYVRERKWKRVKARQFAGLAAERAIRMTTMKAVMGGAEIDFAGGVLDGIDTSRPENANGAIRNRVTYGREGKAKRTTQGASPSTLGGVSSAADAAVAGAQAGGASTVHAGPAGALAIAGGARGRRKTGSQGAAGAGSKKRSFHLELLKEVERSQRRVWSDVSKQVMVFWGKAQRIVEWKMRKKMERERNAMLSDRLNKLVGQTEKFSRELAVQIGTAATSEKEEDECHQKKDIVGKEGEKKEKEEEYIPMGEDGEDEEATLIAEELAAAAENGMHDPREEVNALAHEADMPIEELIRMYGIDTANATSEDHDGEDEDDVDDEEAKDVSEGRAGSIVMDVFKDEDGDGEFEFASEEDEPDDEATMHDEEMLAEANGERPGAELDSLRAEADVPIEELMKMYGETTMLDVGDDHGEDGAGPSTSRQAGVGSSEDMYTGRSTLKDLLEKANNNDDDDNDFDSLDENDEDDETTFLEEEMLERADAEPGGGTKSNELAQLQNEADMSLEDLMRMYSRGPEAHVSDEDEGEYEEDGNVDDGDDTAGAAATEPLAGGVASVSGMKRNIDDVFRDEDGDTDFIEGSASDDGDDEATLEEEERLACDDAERSDDELAGLKREADMSVEELMRLYGQGFDNDNENVEAEHDGDDGDDDDAGTHMSHETSDDNASISDDDGGSGEDDEEDDRVGLKSLYDDDKEGVDDASYKNRITDISKEALAAQPTGYTLDTTSVKTTVPFLLKHTLREYQHIGLDWLVSMYEKKLNGILADEMGLGKTIMTISLLSWLACEKGMWGPHLIVVPTSVIINWEMEFKKWAPGFKLLVYFGNMKERKLKRQGWSKPNSFHVCITTYTLVIQDAKAFKRRQWQYLILDEAHLIKNWRSLRWQTLLNFHSQRRILITGTPLQNDLMELWSLLHFLMPRVFGSHAEFRELFSNPLTGAVEGTKDLNRALVGRLHGVLRPFLLRRLKSQVEKQLPGKFEHVVKCPMSRRQKRLYEEYMDSVGTQSTLASGNYLGIINVLMQLRKCCNHPDLFAGRAIVSSFDMQPIIVSIPSMIRRIHDEFASEYVSAADIAVTAGETRVATWDVEYWKQSAIGNADSNIETEIEATPMLSFDPNVVGGGGDAVVQRWHAYQADRKRIWRASRARLQERLSRKRCDVGVVYGWNLLKVVAVHDRVHAACVASRDPRCCLSFAPHLVDTVVSYEERAKRMSDIIMTFTCTIPRARTPAPVMVCSRPDVDIAMRAARRSQWAQKELSQRAAFLRPSTVRMQLFFPDRRLVQFDCGKLQQLAMLLRKLMKGGHKVLIFTQMTKMLDVLENFLNLYAYTYLRLDGSTKPEQRQILMQRFNTNPKLFAFILSTRSGGVGINLTGADTVIFYDSDWNPAMDQQAQDRCHRIGQTREVHIYRLITENTIEENILKKSDQKRRLDHLAIQSGSFTTDFLSGNFGEILGTDVPAAAAAATTVSKADIEKALLNAEDADDVKAMRQAKLETAADMNEFEGDPTLQQQQQQQQLQSPDAANGAPVAAPGQGGNVDSAYNDTKTATPVLVQGSTDGKESRMLAGPPSSDDILDRLSLIEKYAVRYVEETGIFVLPSFISSKARGASGAGAATARAANAAAEHLPGPAPGAGGEIVTGPSDDEDDAGASGAGLRASMGTPSRASAAYHAEVKRQKRASGPRIVAERAMDVAERAKLKVKEVHERRSKRTKTVA